MKLLSSARLAALSIGGSAVLAGGLWLGYLTYRSQLALAQAADSVLDVLAAAVLVWTLRVSARASDADHHFGHGRAEPLGALAVAALTGVLAVQVLERAVRALLAGHAPDLDAILVVAFSGKVLFKLAIALLGRRARRAQRAPALDALVVDAQNDVLVGFLALGGFFAARLGWPAIDALLAIPLAVWIGWSGLVLGMDNVRLLMGEAPPVERQEQLLELAAAVEGVRRAHHLRAQYIGPGVWVHLSIDVDRKLSVETAHDIGEKVEARLAIEPDIEHVHVHVEPESGASS